MDNRPPPSAPDGPSQRAGSTRALAIGAAALTVALVVSLGLVFVSSQATDQVAENAANLHWTNSMLGGAGLARAASAQAVFFGVDEQIGVASAGAARRALAEARSTLQPIAANPSVPLLGSAGDETIELNLSRFVGAAQSVIDLLEANRVEAAADAHQLELEPAFAALQADLLQRQALIEMRIEDSETLAGRISVATQFLVTLLIPVAALLLYRRIVGRQVREAGLVMEARLRAEQELNRAKDEFIAGISHEFRTPLTSIFGFSEVLIDSGMIDPESSMELIGLINSESAELSRMVEDLLTAARLESEALTISTTTVDPAEIVESVLGPWRRSGHDILVDLAPAAVIADPLRLRQILRNLISNAVKHGGRHVAVVGLLVQDGYAWSIVDDGPGVSDEIAGRLFERYIHDGRRALLAGSVGLGLNIARSLAEAMGGSLEYSRNDGATWFTLVSPIAETSDRAAEAVDVGVA